MLWLSLVWSLGMFLCQVIHEEASPERATALQRFWPALSCCTQLARMGCWAQRFRSSTAYGWDAPGRCSSHFVLLIGANAAVLHACTAAHSGPAGSIALATDLALMCRLLSRAAACSCCGSSNRGMLTVLHACRGALFSWPFICGFC